MISHYKKLTYISAVEKNQELVLEVLKITTFAYILGYILWRLITVLIDIIDYSLLGNSPVTDLVAHISYAGIYDDFLRFGIDQGGWKYLYFFHYLQYFMIFFLYHKKCNKLFGKETIFFSDPLTLK